MKIAYLAATAAVLALTAAGCSKSGDTAASTPNTSDASAAATPASATAGAAGPSGSAMTPASAAATPAPTDAAGFVQKAAGSDMFEIAEAKIAESKAKSADVKAFARMMITDHTKSTQKLKAAIAKSGQTLTPPATLPADLQSKVDALNQASAADFDKTYMQQQVDAHTDTLAAMQAYAQSGDTPALKDFATSTSKVVQMHLDKAKAIQSKLQ